jgi:hypothetical protein
MTVKAWHMVRCNNPVFYTKPNNTFTYLSNPACNFMAQNQRCTLDAIPFHDITSTDGTCENLHKEFTRPDPGDLHFLKPHIPVIVIHRNSHKY